MHGMGVPEHMPTSELLLGVLTGFGPSFLPLTPGQLLHPTVAASTS